MFSVNEDMSIYVTRGDAVIFPLTAEENGVPYYFQAGDTIRFLVYEKKKPGNVVLNKKFLVPEKTDQVNLAFTEAEMKIGDAISKPTDYWYEVELNPDTDPQTIVGYDDDGPKIFRVFPEGIISQADFPGSGDVSGYDLEKLIFRLKSGKVEDAELHLGFYIDADGYLCQKGVENERTE